MNEMQEQMNKANKVSDQDRYARRIQSNKIRDVVSPQRLDNPFSLPSATIDEYLQFPATENPAKPPRGSYRLFAKSSGEQTDIFVIDSAGIVKELYAASAITLDDAYSNGSIINVDSGDISLLLNDNLGLNLTNNDGSTSYFSVRQTGITSSINQSFLVDAGVFFRNASTSINSNDDGYLDLNASTGIRLNALGVEIESVAITNASIASSSVTTLTADSATIEDLSTTSLSADTITIDVDLSAPLATILSLDADVAQIADASIESLSVSTSFESTGVATFEAGRIDAKTSAEIESGEIEAESSYMQIDTEASAASDDLETITGGEVGMELTIEATDASRVITVKDGIGNLYLSGDCTLDSPHDKITLIKAAADEWHEKCRSNNS